MNETVQTILALALVTAALGYLFWGWLRRRGDSPCARGGCGCGKAVLAPHRKEKNRRQVSPVGEGEAD